MGKNVLFRLVNIKQYNYLNHLKVRVKNAEGFRVYQAFRHNQIPIVEVFF